MIFINSIHIWQVIIHKREVIKLTWKFKKYFYIPAYLHDTDKIFLMLLAPKRIASWFHKRFAFHHINNIWGVKFYFEIMLDWESARFTKRKKKHTAIEWYFEIIEKLSNEDKINLEKNFFIYLDLPIEKCGNLRRRTKI